MNAVEVSDFTFAYPDSDTCLHHLSWSVPEGAFALLVGRTGSGKTTLLRNLKPEIAPVGERSGSIRVFGRLLDAWEERESAAGIGYVSQHPENQVVCDKVWHELAFGLENLGMGQDEMRRRIAEVANFFGLGPIVNQDTSSLSGGQCQLVCVAGVIALRPRLLLLDEPTSQLDPIASKNFLHMLFRVNRELGITVVVCTHEPEVAADYATECYELVDGAMVEGDLATYRRRAHGADGSRRDAAIPVRQIPVQVQARRKKTEVLVSANDLYFRYDRNLPWILRGCDLTVRHGMAHVLVGGNGSGKSTLLCLVAGLLRPQHGRVSSGVAEAQALLPQDPKALFVCDTVGEELREWQRRCGYDDAAVDAALDAAGLAAMCDRSPYDLSGGQQQKLALHKLLLTRPNLLLLDEPTKGIDSQGRVELAEILRRLVDSGTTLLMSSYDFAFCARVCDEVSLLFDGQVACTCGVDDFFRDNLFYRPPLDGFAELWDARHGTRAVREEL